VPLPHPLVKDTNPVSTFNRAALVKVLEVLDSPHTGEALAAAQLASAMVREAGLTWDDVLAPELGQNEIGQNEIGQAPVAARPVGSGPFGYRRDRELSPHEQFFMVLLSPRTPTEIKRKLRGLETRVLDGEITPQETQDLKFMYQSFVVG
jgi:hypothetical protein